MEHGFYGNSEVISACHISVSCLSHFFQHKKKSKKHKHKGKQKKKKKTEETDSSSDDSDSGGGDGTITGSVSNEELLQRSGVLPLVISLSMILTFNDFQC